VSHCWLTQGMAASRQFTDCTGKCFSLALISRRSCLHPGMRYIARGLNALASPGNESEVEQIVWTAQPGRQPAT
jgi:SacI homology domain